MKQVIPFYKEIVFKTNIAIITSISLEHEENILDGEVSGNFIIFGKYKIHNDTTEEVDFKYKLPFTALIPDDIDKDTIIIDIENFTFDQIEEDVIRINIDFSITGENKVIVAEIIEEDIEKECLENIDREIDEILGVTEEVLTEEVDTIEREEIMNDDTNYIVKHDISNITDVIPDIKIHEETSNIEEDNEYVTYHVHLVKDGETIEQIINTYKTNFELLKEYNDIMEIKIGDKLIIPEYGEE